MFVNDLFHEDDVLREQALAMLAAVPDHTRAALAARLAPTAREAAGKIAEGDVSVLVPFSRTVAALAHLRVESAKNCLLRLAEDESDPVKAAIARSLAGIRTVEARAVLVHLFSDDATRAEAIRAVRAAPWPEVLPALIELAEADDELALATVPVIGLCGASGGTPEAFAATDFLTELLDDEALVIPAVEAILRHRFVVGTARATALARGSGPRRAAGLALLATAGVDRDACFGSLFALIAAGAVSDAPRLLHAVDASLLLTAFARARESGDDAARANAERAWSLLS